MPFPLIEFLTPVVISAFIGGASVWLVFRIFYGR